MGGDCGGGERVSVDAPIAEDAHNGLWLVAYVAPCGGLDVMAYRYRRDGSAVDHGACVWCGRVRDGRWSGVVGEPRASVLASAWSWCQASALRSAATPR